MGGNCQWEGVSIEVEGPSGGVWTLWNPKTISATHHSSGLHSISSEFKTIATGESWVPSKYLWTKQLEKNCGQK